MQLSLHYFLYFGATEAEEAGADLEAIQSALTHSKKDMTLRYIRRRSSKIAAIANARSSKRAAEQNDGGTS
jgi:integrase